MRNAVLVVTVLILLVTEVRTQSMEMTPYESDILAARPVRTWLGLGVGGYGYWHDGSFSPNCNCDFGGERGGDPMFALDLSRHYPKLGFAIRAKVTYYDVSALFEYEQTRRTVQVGGKPDIDVLYHKSSDVTLRYIAFTPSFAWYPPKTSFYVQGGLEIGFPLKARYNHVETILTPDLTYFNGENTVTLLEESDIPGGEVVRLALAAGIGYDIQLSNRIMLTPQAGINLPLTNVSSNDSWSVKTAYGLIFLKFRLW